MRAEDVGVANEILLLLRGLVVFHEEYAETNQRGVQDAEMRVVLAAQQAMTIVNAYRAEDIARLGAPARAITWAGYNATQAQTLSKEDFDARREEKKALALAARLLTLQSTPANDPMQFNNRFMEVQSTAAATAGHGHTKGGEKTLRIVCRSYMIEANNYRDRVAAHLNTTLAGMSAKNSAAHLERFPTDVKLGEHFTVQPLPTRKEQTDKDGNAVGHKPWTTLATAHYRNILRWIKNLAPTQNDASVKQVFESEAIKPWFAGYGLSMDGSTRKVWFFFRLEWRREMTTRRTLGDPKLIFVPRGYADWLAGGGYDLPFQQGDYVCTSTQDFEHKARRLTNADVDLVVTQAV